MVSQPDEKDAELRALARENLNNLRCPEWSCASQGFAGVVLSSAGSHIKASCKRCGRYIKFVKQ